MAELKKKTAYIANFSFVFSPSYTHRIGGTLLFWHVNDSERRWAKVLDTRAPRSRIIKHYKLLITIVSKKNVDTATKYPQIRVRSSCFETTGLSPFSASRTFDRGTLSVSFWERVFIRTNSGRSISQDNFRFTI